MVFGIGIRFVRYNGDAQEEHVVEGALVHEVEAGFIAMEQGQFGGCGEAAEGSGVAGYIVALGRRRRASSRRLFCMAQARRRRQ